MNRLLASTQHAPLLRLLIALMLLFAVAGCSSGSKMAAEKSAETVTPAAKIEPTVRAEASANPEVGTEATTSEPTVTAVTGPGIADGSTAREIRYRFLPIPLDVSPTSLAIDGETVWVTAADDGQIVAVDLAAGAVSRTLDVGGKPYRLVLGQGALWTVDAPLADAWVRRIDPQTGNVSAQIKPPPGTYPTPRRIAAGEGSVWAPLEGTGALASIDPATNALGDIITDRPKLSAGEDAPLLVAFGSAWVIDSNEGRLLRVDSKTREIIAAVADLGHQEEKQGDSSSILAEGPTALAADDQGVWVLSDVANTKASAPNIDGGGTLFFIDPAANQITKRIDLEAEADKSLDPALALADGSAWFVDTTGVIIRVDLTTGLETRILPEKGFLSSAGIAVAGDKVWLAGENTSAEPPYDLGLFAIDRVAVADFITQKQ